MPTASEMNLKRREDDTFPSVNAFQRFGPKATWPAQVRAYCRDRPDCADITEIVALLIVQDEPRLDESDDDGTTAHGFVYLLKSGRHYKIGHTFDVGRRRYDLAIQLPEAVSEEHLIRTDDPPGIECYWHSRFADRRKNREWFDLSRADIAAFKRRKFM